MADVVVSALVNKTVDIAADLVISESSRLYWLSEDINWLVRQLRHMQSYLEDAEAKKVTDPKVANLLKDIRDLADDVEDIFDIYLPEIESHRSMGSIKRAANILSYGHTCSGFAREIEKIKRRVEGIDADRINYGIECTRPSASGGQVDPRSTALHFDEPIVVGFDKDIEKLKMKLLSHEEEEHVVVSIVGMAGMGKTTLAKKVFRYCKASGYGGGDETRRRHKSQSLLFSPNEKFPQSHECFPPNIVELKLHYTYLREDPMQVLKKLPKLKILKLQKRSYMGTTLDYSGLDSFPRLQTLRLEGLEDLVELVDGDQGMSPPNLRQVIISKCHRFVRTPESLEPFVTRIPYF